MSMTPSSVAFRWLTHVYFHFVFFSFLGVQEGGEGGNWSDELLESFKKNTMWVYLHVCYVSTLCFQAQLILPTHPYKFVALFYALE